MRSLRVVPLLSVVVAALLLAGAASAGDPALVDQYQEPFPTGGGNIHTGGGQGGGGQGAGGQGDSAQGGGTAQLPPSTLDDLYGSVSEPVATALEAVATSPELGAPPTAGRAREAAPPLPTSFSSGGPLEELADVAIGDGSSRVVTVVLALALATLGGALLAVLLRRARMRSPLR